MHQVQDTLVRLHGKTQREGSGFRIKERVIVQLNWNLKVPNNTPQTKEVSCPRRMFFPQMI